MSRDRRDKRGGHSQKWYCSFKPGTVRSILSKGHRKTRARVRDDLRKGREPHPNYPHENYYLD